MKQWIAFQIFEFKRFSKKRFRLITATILVLLTLLFVQIGAGKLKKMHNERPVFQELERLKVTMYVTYTQYGTYGIRYMFIPDPIFPLFINSGVIDNINAYVDSGERLKIYSSLIGSNLFQLKKYAFTDFSGIVLFFGSLLAALYGIDGLSRQKYLKFLESVVKKSGGVYIYLALSRLLILLGLLAIITGGAVLVIYLNGLPFSFNASFFNFLLLMLLVTLYFFFLGTVFSTCRSRSTGITALFTCWFLLLFIIPASFHYYIAETSELMTSIYQLEQKKLKLVMDFEKSAIKELGTFDYGKDVSDRRKQKILSYYENELKKINELEEKLRIQMKKYTARFQRLSLLFPTTFYLSSCSEISSTGYKSIIEFYKYVHDSKLDFFKFFMDKIYFSENASNFANVESFIKGDENVFLSHSRLPLFFGWGVAITFLHILILLIVSYSRYKRFTASLTPKSSYDKSPVDLDLKNEEFEVLECEEDIYMEFIYNTFAGKTGNQRHQGNPGTVKVNGQDITAEKNPYDFSYFCHPDHFPPEVKTGDLIRFYGRLLKVPAGEIDDIVKTYSLNSIMNKKIKALKKIQKGDLVLAVLSMAKRKVYLVEDAALNMPIEFAVRLKEKMDQTAKEGALVLYLTSTDQVFDRSAEKGPGIYVSSSWIQLVDHYKELHGIK
jgi:ABC-type transport system involved in cytochrome c biogenesis ATPase subunit